MDKDKKDKAAYWFELAQAYIDNYGNDRSENILLLATDLRHAYMQGIERGRWLSDNSPR